jgi:predicted dienelactone hydrolase
VTVRFLTASLLASVALFAGVAAPAAAAEPGVRVLEVPVPHRPRPLRVQFYYPARADGDLQQIGANPLFIGTPMRRDATPEPGRHPLVLLSHGSGGNAENLAWLGSALARNGYLVAAPDHPGTTSGDSRPADAVKLWERPADLSALLDRLETDPALAPSIDTGDVSVAGFSLGGFTALASVGVRLDREAYAAYCDRDWPDAPLISECRWLKSGTDLHQLDPRIDGMVRDERIRRAVAIDPGLAHAATSDSLSAVSVPVTVISMGDAGRLPPAVETARVGSLIPGARQVYVPGAIHFSVLGECRANGRDILIAEREPEPLCDDGGRPRAELHREIAEHVLAGLAR